LIRAWASGISSGACRGLRRRAGAGRFRRVDAVASEKPGDVEPGLPNLHDAVASVGGAKDAVPINRPPLVKSALTSQSPAGFTASADRELGLAESLRRRGACQSMRRAADSMFARTSWVGLPIVRPALVSTVRRGDRQVASLPTVLPIPTSSTRRRRHSD